MSGPASTSTAVGVEISGRSGSLTVSRSINRRLRPAVKWGRTSAHPLVSVAEIAARARTPAAVWVRSGEVSLKTRPADARDAEIGRLKEKVGDLTMAKELLEAKLERLETGRPLARRRSRR